MKTKKIFLTAALIAVSFTTFAQVGVGTTDPKAGLDITSDKGMLLPRMADHTTLTPVDGTLDANEAGLQVYNTTTNKVMLWTGTAWVASATGTAKFVDGTTPADAVFTGGNVGIGTTEPTAKLHIKENQNNFTGLTLENEDTGNLARAGFTVGTGGSGKNLVTSHIGDNFFLTSFELLTQNTGVIYSGGQSDGLNIVSAKIGSVMRFGVGGLSAGNTKMKLTSNGNLLINNNAFVNTPNHRLVVGDDIGAITLAETLVVADSDNAARIYIGETNNQYAALLWNNTTNQFSVITNNSGALSTNAFVIDTPNNNNVGIGTTTPTSKLQVVGLPTHVDNAAALTAGLTAGAFYHTGDGIVRVVF